MRFEIWVSVEKSIWNAQSITDKICLKASQPNPVNTLIWKPHMTTYDAWDEQKDTLQQLEISVELFATIGCLGCCTISSLSPA